MADTPNGPEVVHTILDIPFVSREDSCLDPVRQELDVMYGGGTQILRVFRQRTLLDPPNRRRYTDQPPRELEGELKLDFINGREHTEGIKSGYRAGLSEGAIILLGTYAETVPTFLREI